MRHTKGKAPQGVLLFRDFYSPLYEGDQQSNVYKEDKTMLTIMASEKALFVLLGLALYFTVKICDYYNERDRKAGAR